VWQSALPGAVGAYVCTVCVRSQRADRSIQSYLTALSGDADIDQFPIHALLHPSCSFGDTPTIHGIR
jgi:hypothetical protein